MDLIPKAKIEAIVADELCESLVDAIMKGSQTGKIGDGEISVTEAIQTVRIRTGELDANAV